jgi:hypothetical protein
MRASYSQRMTDTGSAPDITKAAAPGASGPFPLAGRTTSLVGSVLGRSVWLGTWLGAVTGPLVAFATLLLASLGTASPDDWLFGLVFVVWAFFPLAGVGAGIGFFVGAGGGAAVLLALWLEARSVWRVGDGVRVASVAVGSVVGGAIVLPVAAGIFPQGAFAVPFVLVGAVLIASVVASRQGNALEKVRLRSAPGAAVTPAGSFPAPAARMPRSRVFRLWGSLVGALLLLALVELAAALPRVTAYSSCSEQSDSFFSRVEFGLWPPQLTCVFVDGSIELVPRVVFVAASAIALLAAGLLASGIVGSIREARRGGQMRVSLSLLGSIGMMLVCLILAFVTAVGVFAPAAALRPGDPRSAPVYNPPPAEIVPDEASTPEPTVTPEPVAPPVEVPPPSSTYTLSALTTELQALVDATFVAAGAIVDPAIPPETQTFAVSAGECYVGAYTGQTARLEVGFDTADVEQSLDRVRALWAAEGYELYERTTNAKGEVLDPSIAVNASGTDPQPAATLGIRVYDGFLILNVEGLCVSR